MHSNINFGHWLWNSELEGIVQDHPELSRASRIMIQNLIPEFTGEKPGSEGEEVQQGGKNQGLGNRGPTSSLLGNLRRGYLVSCQPQIFIFKKDAYLSGRFKESVIPWVCFPAPRHCAWCWGYTEKRDTALTTRRADLGWRLNEITGHKAKHCGPLSQVPVKFLKGWRVCAFISEFWVIEHGAWHTEGTSASVCWTIYIFFLSQGKGEL